MNKRQDEMVDNKDANYDGARRIVAFFAWVVYIGCSILILAGICILMNKLGNEDPDWPFGVGLIVYALPSALFTYVAQKLLDAIFELVKNTRQIRDELQTARKNEAWQDHLRNL